MSDQEREEKAEALRLRALSNIDQLEAAEGDLAAALSIQPRSGQLWFDRGAVHEHHQRLEDAVQYYEKARAHDRRNRVFEKAWRKAKSRLEKSRLKAQLEGLFVSREEPRVQQDPPVVSPEPDAQPQRPRGEQQQQEDGPLHGSLAMPARLPRVRIAAPQGGSGQEQAKSPGLEVGPRRPAVRPAAGGPAPGKLRPVPMDGGLDQGPITSVPPKDPVETTPATEGAPIDQLPGAGEAPTTRAGAKMAHLGLSPDTPGHHDETMLLEGETVDAPGAVAEPSIRQRETKYLQREEAGKTAFLDMALSGDAQREADQPERQPEEASRPGPDVAPPPNEDGTEIMWADEMSLDTGPASPTGAGEGDLDSDLLAQILEEHPSELDIDDAETVEMSSKDLGHLGEDAEHHEAEPSVIVEPGVITGELRQLSETARESLDLIRSGAALHVLRELWSRAAGDAGLDPGEHSYLMVEAHLALAGEHLERISSQETGDLCAERVEQLRRWFRRIHGR